MSCKYCNLKRRKDGDVEWIAGEEWKSESDDGGYICPHDNGFRMLVYYDARCACTAVDNIKYCPFCGAKLAMPKEPLIKDEKIRKAVRAWADIVRESEFRYDRFERRLYTISKYISSFSISFPTNLDLIEMKDYTLEELCGEEK